MHLEIQVALNFVISYMYNKLPRRRVNIFGEELEKALKLKFEGHWYPNAPMKGSGYRCIKTGEPIDPVIERAARAAGMELSDIKENLPEELAVWVDPGEVSYRIGEKSSIKVLFSESLDSANQEDSLDKEVTKTFNPEAQCFKPIEELSSSLSSVSISPKSTSPYSSNSPTPPFKTRETSPITSYLQKSAAAPLTFTAASFAQTKFGSTKLKTNTKRANRMSPTEFSNYIKQRQIIQQQQQHGIIGAPNNFFSQFAPNNRPKSMSPAPPHMDPNMYLSGALNQGTSPGSNSFNPWARNMFDQGFHSMTGAPSGSGYENLISPIGSNSCPTNPTKFPPGFETLNNNNGFITMPGFVGSNGGVGGNSSVPPIGTAEKTNQSLGGDASYSAPHQFQHLLLAK